MPVTQPSCEFATPLGHPFARHDIWSLETGQILHNPFSRLVFETWSVLDELCGAEEWTGILWEAMRDLHLRR